MKRMMIFAFTMMMAFVAFAQKSPGTLTLYPRVGMSFSKFCGDKIYTDILNSAGGHVDAKFKTGFTAGAELQYQLSDIIALSGGVIYSEQGTKFGSIEGIDDVEIKHNDINVPLLCVLTTKYGFSLKAGLQPEFRVSDKFDKILNEVNLSIPVGIAYEYRNFCLDLRYNIGLTHIYKDQSTYDKSHNGTIMLTLGYGIDL